MRRIGTALSVLPWRGVEAVFWPLPTAHFSAQYRPPSGRPGAYLGPQICVGRRVQRNELRTREGHGRPHRKKQGALKVKKTSFWAVVMTAMLAMGPGNAFAQAPQQFVGGVAIIDLSYIFKNHERFKAMNENMRNEV